MNEHRFALEPYRTPASRYTCPSCGEKRMFSRYIDIETRQQLADHVGRCNREQNCGYHYTPSQYFHSNPDSVSNYSQPVIHTLLKTPKQTSLIPLEIVNQSLKCYQNNHFVTYLHTLFNEKTVNGLIDLYKIGTSKYWKGAVVFWQIDCSGKVRAGKVMLYDSGNGRRKKKPFNHISWVHSILKIKNYELKQCFFGEHLLQLYPVMPVAIVESEKTAIIASIYFPQFIWIATGGKNGSKWTTREVWKVLISRKVVLWPDINAFQDWERKAIDLKKQGLKIDISCLLESESTEEERASGLDIADFLIRFPVERFRNAQFSQPP